MVIAWIFAVSIGVILPRFYKPMWPESKLFGEKVWFQVGARKRNVLFNDTLNTFYLRLYDVRHMVKDHSDSKRGNPLLPHGLLFPISSKGSFICIMPQTGMLHQS